MRTARGSVAWHPAVTWGSAGLLGAALVAGWVWLLARFLHFDEFVAFYLSAVVAVPLFVWLVGWHLTSTPIQRRGRWRRRAVVLLACAGLVPPAAFALGRGYVGFVLVIPALACAGSAVLLAARHRPAMGRDPVVRAVTRLGWLGVVINGLVAAAITLFVAGLLGLFGLLAVVNRPVPLPAPEPDAVVGIVVTIQDLPWAGPSPVWDGEVVAVREDRFEALVQVADLDRAALDLDLVNTGRELAVRPRSDEVRAAGGVVSGLDEGKFRLELEPGTHLLCYLSGAYRCFLEELAPGDVCRLVTGAGSWLSCSRPSRPDPSGTSQAAGQSVS